MRRHVQRPIRRALTARRRSLIGGVCIRHLIVILIEMRLISDEAVLGDNSLQQPLCHIIVVD